MASDPSGPYTRDDVGRKALLHAPNGKYYDVLVVRETRGRYQVRLAESEPPNTRVTITQGSRVLCHGVTTSVPISAVELR